MLASLPTPIHVDTSAIYTIPAIVLSLGVPSSTVRAAIRRGDLPSVRRGSQDYISGRHLLAWLTGEPAGEVAHASD